MLVTEAIYHYLGIQIPTLASIRFISHHGMVDRLGIMARHVDPLENKIAYTEVGEVEVINGFLNIRAYGHDRAQQWHKSISDPAILDGAVDEINRIINLYQSSTTQTY